MLTKRDALVRTADRPLRDGPLGFRTFGVHNQGIGMAGTTNYPAVYVEEIPSASHPIEGVPTSDAAFVGATASGPTDAPRLVTSFLEYEQIYGGLADESSVSPPSADDGGGET